MTVGTIIIRRLTVRLLSYSLISTGANCQILTVSQDKRQTCMYPWYPLFHVLWIDMLSREHHLSNVLWSLKKFLIINHFPENLLFEDCLVWIEDEIDEKTKSVGFHRNTDCLLKIMSFNRNKKVVNENNHTFGWYWFHRMFCLNRSCFLYKVWCIPS